MKSRNLHLTACFKHRASSDTALVREINMKWTRSDSKTEKRWTINWIYLKRFPIYFFSTKLEEIAYSLPFLLDINRQYYLRKEKSHIL